MGLALMLMLLTALARWQFFSDLHDSFWPPYMHPIGFAEYVYRTISYIVMAATLSLLHLAPLPDDLRLTQFNCVLSLMYALFFLLVFCIFASYWINLASVDKCEVHLVRVSALHCCFFALGEVILSCIALFLIFGYILTLSCSSTPSRMQERMGNLLLCVASCVAIVAIFFAMYTAVAHDALDRKTTTLPGCLAVVCMSRWPQLRPTIQSRISSLYEAHSTLAACAGIAALMSECSLAEALTRATEHFRSVDISRLEIQHFRSSPSNPKSKGPKPYVVAELTKLGECDAFVSHSWHDNVEEKWFALQRWREQFILREGREPRIWFDKCCIDQQNIEENLRGLPVFLCGCNELLVLCGPTYLTRLWCVVELFTFVHMGGSKHRITVLPLAPADVEEQDSHRIEQRLSDFDARQCDCSQSDDKDRMLKIICTAYGSMESFNTAVRVMFRTIGLQGNLMDPSNAARGDSADKMSQR
jgi:hypothetical protein